MHVCLYVCVCKWPAIIAHICFLPQSFCWSAMSKITALKAVQPLIGTGDVVCLGFSRPASMSKPGQGLSQHRRLCPASWTRPRFQTFSWSELWKSTETYPNLPNDTQWCPMRSAILSPSSSHTNSYKMGGACAAPPFWRLTLMIDQKMFQYVPAEFLQSVTIFRGNLQTFVGFSCELLPFLQPAGATPKFRLQFLCRQRRQTVVVEP